MRQNQWLRRDSGPGLIALIHDGQAYNAATARQGAGSWNGAKGRNKWSQEQAGRWSPATIVPFKM